jgi:hypothetical protein
MSFVERGPGSTAPPAFPDLRRAVSLERGAPRYWMAPKTFRMSPLDCPSGSLRMARSSSASME